MPQKKWSVIRISLKWHQLLKFRLSKLYKKFRQPAFVFWPVILSKINMAEGSSANLALILTIFKQIDQFEVSLKIKLFKKS